MPPLLLQLQLPGRGRSWPLASSSDPHLVGLFCRRVLASYEGEAGRVGDEVEAFVLRQEAERMRRVFSLLVPGFETEGEDGEAVPA